MPKWRSARRRHCAGARATCCEMPSTTTKSLPAPCIFVNRNFIDRLSPIVARVDSAVVDHARPSPLALVEVGLAGRPGLEPLVAEEVLLGHLGNPLLDEGIHPPGGRHDVGTRIVLPGGVEGHDVAIVGHPR